MVTRRFDVRIAFDDLLLGLRQLPLAFHLAMQEIRLRYARTVFGPFWITATLALYVLTLSFVFGGLFGASIRGIIPWITLGLIAWYFIAQVFVESSTILQLNRGILLQAKMSISMFVALVVIRNLLVAAHHLIVFVVLVLALQLTISWSMLWVLLAIPIITTVAFGIGLIAAITGTRFRDLPPLYANLATIGLFALPIMWRPADLQHFHEITEYNPFTYVLSIFRDPLLGIEPSAHAMLISLSMGGMALAISLALLALTRRRVILWL